MCPKDDMSEPAGRQNDLNEAARFAYNSFCFLLCKTCLTFHSGEVTFRGADIVCEKKINN